MMVSPSGCRTVMLHCNMIAYEPGAGESQVKIVQRTINWPWGTESLLTKSKTANGHDGCERITGRQNARTWPTFFANYGNLSMLTLSNRQKSDRVAASFVTREGEDGRMVGLLLTDAFAKTMNL
jgi:hypothetical protein